VGRFSNCSEKYGRVHFVDRKQVFTEECDRSARRVSNIGDRTIGFQISMLVTLKFVRLPQAEATRVERRTGIRCGNTVLISTTIIRFAWIRINLFDTRSTSLPLVHAPPA
jgi:hypothetical protein